jgi:hypothetical protein
MPMVHPVTGEAISSYKKLMKDPLTAETWQTAFGKDFGGMCQGITKTGMVSTDSMFVMTPEEVTNMPLTDLRLMQTSLWIIGPKKRTRTASKSQLVAT